MGQARAVVERRVAYIQERAGEAQHGDAGASGEGIARYGGGAFFNGEYSRGRTLIGICHIAGIHNAVGLIVEPSGICKRVLIDISHRSGNGNIGQIGAARESIVAYCFHFGGNVHTCQTLAVMERIGEDCLDSIGNGNA